MPIKYLFFSGLLFGCLFTAFVGLLIQQHPRKPRDFGANQFITSIPSELQRTISPVESKDNTSVRLPILMYHYVEYIKNKRDTIRASLNIVPSVLVSQIKTLKDAGYIFVTPSYLTLAFDGKIQPADKIVMLTFDDGYRDFYTDVFPILQKEQVRAVAYVVPNFLDKPNFMFTSQLKGIANSPYVEIGAHTMDHVLLRGMNLKKAQQEIAQSKSTLEALLHRPVNAFAYPYGAFDTQAMSLVQQAGFTTAVVTVPGITQSQRNKYYLYRLRPGTRTGKVLLDFLKQNTFKEY